MGGNGLARIGLAAASGALLVLGYQPFAYSAVGWIALTPLLIALRGVGAGAAIGLGWLTGTLTCLGVAGFWIWSAASAYFGLSASVAALFTIGVTQIFVAPFFALFGLLASLCVRSRAHFFLVPAAFVASEYARAALVGNPWELLGHSQRTLTLVQVVGLTGVYGLSFLLALTANAAAELVEALRRARHRAGIDIGRVIVAAASALLVAALVLAYGRWRLREDTATSAELPVLLVQGNIADRERARPDRAGEAVRRYIELTQSVTPLPPLVLWPENAIAVFPESNTALLEPLRDLVERDAVTVLAGAPRAGDRPGVAAIYNSVYAFAADNGRAVYDKRYLLPFVERFPLRPQDGPYMRGTSDDPISIASVRAGILVCYEVIFPAASRGAIADGANLLVNLSNDTWFEAGAGPAQHWELARFRAVEDGVSLVRATNTGISGAFDPNGRELARLPVDVAIASAVTVPLRAGGTFYARHGEWFAGACRVAVFLALVPIVRRRR
jgi:apolipoprotein N-acyltransferase